MNLEVRIVQVDIVMLSVNLYEEGGEEREHEAINSGQFQHSSIKKKVN